MKKIIIIISLLLSFQFGAKAQWVTIPDAHFVAYLQAHFPSCMNGNLMDTTCAGITSATYVNCANDTIADLTGIQYFDNLQNLFCSHNLLTSLPPLPNSLTHLGCDNNQLTSLPPLPNSLTNLDCGNNQLTSLPPLPNSLQSLNCDYNQLTSLPALPNSIEGIACSFNQLTNLPSLPNSLGYLFCDNNQLTSLPILPNSVFSLECFVNQLTSLPTLPNSLTYLHCGDNQLTSLPSLPSNTQDLICYQNQLTTLPSLPNNITFLGCDLNQLTSLPLLPNNITILFCNKNQLTSLPTLPNSLTILGCVQNQLTNLPTLPNSLVSFYCGNNHLANLPAFPNTLNTLGCDSNNISCFPIFPNSLISGPFNISANPFTCLPNYVPAMNSTYLAYPLCSTGNVNGCTVAQGIIGYTYKDSNGDCIYNTADTTKRNIKEQLYDSGSNLIGQTFSAMNGVYDFPDSVGTYTVKIDTVGVPYTVQCTLPGIDSVVVLTAANALQTNVNFPIICKPGFDVGVQSVNHDNVWFPGQPEMLRVVAGDMSHWFGLNCAAGVSGQVVITVTGPVTFTNVASGSLTPFISGTTYTYTIADFGAINNTTAFGLNFMVNTSASTGNSVCVNISVTPTSGDNNTSNNTYVECFYVVNSFDPNYKETYPEQVLPAYDDYFTYTVHFQNTGSAATININLQDTLDANLDLNTFQVINYSHYCTSLLTGNKLSFNFPNIQLADSSTDFNGSQGFVQYRIKPLANLPAGTLIHNRASIYFDYNAPVLTNTTTNEFMLGVGVPSTIKASSISIYPNPSSGVFRIDAGNNKLKEIKVTDVLGRIVLVTNINSSNTTIDLSKETKGVYFIQLSDENNNRVNKKIIIE